MLQFLIKGEHKFQSNLKINIYIKYIYILMHLTTAYANFDDDLHVGTLQIGPFGTELIFHLKFHLQ